MSVDGGQPEHRSGLRNPAAAVRGVGAGALCLEALALLLAILPIRRIGGDSSGGTLVAVVVLAVSAIVTAGLLRRPWAWHAGTALQVCLVAAGFLHWSLTVLGVVFGLVWLYVLHIRRRVLT